MLMDMNFPHRALRQSAEPVTGNAETVLDAARARQANSRTVRALRRAEHGNTVESDDLAARIHCFTAEPSAEIAVRGSFWEKATTKNE